MVLDDRLSILERDSANGLSSWGKVNFLWDESTMKDYLNLWDNQVNALNLLLKPCNGKWQNIRNLLLYENRVHKLERSQTTFDQKTMLERYECRELLSRVKR